MKILMCITGLPGSGKSFVADMISKRYGAKVFHSGDIIREEVKKRGLAYTPENDRKVAEWFHSDGREKLLVKRAWNQVKDSAGWIVIIDGFRSYPEILYLKELSGKNPVLVKVTAPFKVREKRELARGRFKHGETVSYLKQRDADEMKRGLARMLKKAQYKIDNSDGEDKLKGNVESFMKRVLKSKT